MAYAWDNFLLCGGPFLVLIPPQRTVNCVPEAGFWEKEKMGWATICFLSCLWHLFTGFCVAWPLRLKIPLHWMAMIIFLSGDFSKGSSQIPLWDGFFFFFFYFQDRISHCSLNSNTWETEAGEDLWIGGQPGLHSKFQASQGYIKTTSIKNKRERNTIYPSSLQSPFCILPQSW